MSRIEYVASKPTSVFPLPRTRLLGNAVARNRTPVQFGQRYHNNGANVLEPNRETPQLQVRFARRAAALPDWVLDHLLVHELAHLVHSDHGAAFHELENRYPLTERARGYLLALDSMA